MEEIGWPTRRSLKLVELKKLNSAATFMEEVNVDGAGQLKMIKATRSLGETRQGIFTYDRGNIIVTTLSLKPSSVSWFPLSSSEAQILGNNRIFIEETNVVYSLGNKILFF